MAVKGSHLTPEHKEKVRLAMKGRVMTAEHRAHLSEANRRRGGTATPETRRLIGQASAARWRDPDYRARQRAARQKRRVRAPHVIGRCAYCFAPATEWDHLHPRTRGGSSAPHNLVPACRSCNASKGNLTIPEWQLTARGMRTLGPIKPEWTFQMVLVQ